MAETIYKYKNIEFTTDDIYICKNGTNNLNFFLNTSKYFDIKYSKFNHTNFTNLHCRTKKIKHLLINSIFECNLIPKSRIVKNEMDIGYYSGFGIEGINHFKLFPADYINFDSYWENIKIKNYHLSTYRLNIRHKHKDQYKCAKKKYNLLGQKAYDLILQQPELCFKVTKKYSYMRNKSYKISYKKLKPFNTIYSRPVFTNPLELITLSILSFLEDGDSYSLNAYYIFDKLSDKKKYKLTRYFFILMMQHRQIDIINFFKSGDKLTKPNWNISEKMIAKYSKMFNQLYHDIKSYTFKDVKDKDDLYHYIYMNHCYNVKDEKYQKLIDSKLNCKVVNDLKKSVKIMENHCNDSYGLPYNISIKYRLLDEFNRVIQSTLFSSYFKLDNTLLQNNDTYMHAYAFYKPNNWRKQRLTKINHIEYDKKDKLDCLIFVKRK